MTQDHPITPPPELMQQWANAWHTGTSSQELFEYIATQAARWGSDQELEACVEWLQDSGVATWAKPLRSDRRPKPTLKQQALEGLRTIECNIPQSQRAFEDSCEHIRRALESLPND